jgi:hypothetical protein
MLDDHLITVLKNRGITEVHILEPELDTRRFLVNQESSAAEPVASSDPAPKIAAPVAAPQARPNQPVVSVQISSNRMSADMRIESAGGKDEQATFNEVMNILEREGVTFGIDDNRIASAIDKWNRTRKPVRVESVAKGIAATVGMEGEVQLNVKYLSDVQHCNAIRNASRFWELTGLGLDLERIDQGMVIAEKLPTIPPIAGRTVTGEVIPCDQVKKSALAIDAASVEVSQDGKQIVAKIAGVCYCVNNLLGVQAVDFDGSAELVLDPDRLRAVVVIHPAGPGGKLPLKREIDDLLGKNQVAFGVRESEAKKLYAMLESNQQPEGPVTIAAGTAAKNGENGKVEFLFNIETRLVPKLNPDGSADFKNLGIIHSAVKGQELARLLAPTKGAPGVDICGREIPAKDGQPALLPVGVNTQPHPDNPNVLIAATDGYVKCSGTTVDIQEGYVIPGDVGFETGNINYAKSVLVKGDVKSGFIVECGGDLEVGGTIEDCKIIAGGTVLAKHGFLGQGKGIIEAKGDVNIGFMKNQTIKSRKNVVIAKEALNCTIYARNTIAVHGNPLSVAGGHLMARDSITVHTAGNASQIRTTLEAGTDFTLVEELKKTEAHIVEIGENRQKLIDPIKKFDHLLTIKRKLPPKEEFLYLKLRNAVVRYDQQLHELEMRKKTIADKMRDMENAFIKIEHGAMPGTILKIGERYFLVRDEVIGPKTVRLIRQEIRIL